MGRRTRGVEVPKIQTQSPFTGQFGHFCGPIGRKNILHSSPSTSPSSSLRYKKNRDKSKYLSNIVKNDEQQYYFTSPSYDEQQYYLTLPNYANQQYYFTAINITSHHQTMPTIFRLEWVNFFSGDLWWCCIYSIILKTATTSAPPRPHRQPQLLQQRAASVLSAPCLICTSPDTPL